MYFQSGETENYLGLWTKRKDAYALYCVPDTKGTIVRDKSLDEMYDVACNYWDKAAGFNFESTKRLNWRISLHADVALAVFDSEKTNDNLVYKAVSKRMLVKKHKQWKIFYESYVPYTNEITNADIYN